jgi:hypothetical protein
MSLRHPYLLAAILVIGLVSTARADIIFTAGNVGNLPDYNLLFNQLFDVPGSSSAPGIATITGHLNNPDQSPVDVTSNESIYASTGQGQASIKAVDGLFNQFAFYLHIPPGGTFTSGIFNVFVEGKKLEGPVTVTVTEGDGTVTTNTSQNVTLNVDSEGQNYFTVQATNLQDIRRIDVKLGVDQKGNPLQITEVKDIRLGGVAAVPEPMSILLLATLVGVVGLVARKRFAT